MKRLSANLRWLFLEWPFYERFAVAAFRVMRETPRTDIRWERSAR